MNFIINLPNIGLSILQDFYTEGLRLCRFLSTYILAFFAVGAELLPEVAVLVGKIRTKIMGFLPKSFPLPKLPTNFSSYLPNHQSVQKVGDWYESLTETSDDSESIPQSLILAIIGIFLLGCAWFTLLIFIA